MRFLLTGLVLLFLQLPPLSSAHGNAGENDIYDNWFSVINEALENPAAQPVPTYDRIAAGFLDLYQETGEIVYLNFALSEGGHAMQSDILSRLSGEELEELHPHLNIIQTNLLSPEDVRMREFSPSDIYIFVRADIPPENRDQARELLDAWQKRLPEAFEKSRAKGALQAQAVIRGYDLLNDFVEVIETGRFILDKAYYPPTDLTLTLYEIISYASRTLGYYTQALKINQNQLQPIAVELDDLNLLYTIKMDYAITLFRIGRVNAALQEYEEIYKNIEFLTKPGYRSALFNNLAISYLNSGNFERYVEFQLEAYDIAKSDNNFSQQLSILRNLFIFYRRQNVTELAFSYLQQALQLAEEENLRSETASILLSLGIYFLEVEKDPDTALTHFERAKEVAQNANNFHHYYNSLIELGELHVETGNVELAEDYFFRAMNLSENRQDEAGAIQAVMRLANLYTKTDRFDLAAAISEPYKLEDFNQLQFNLQVLATNTLLKFYLHYNDYDHAVKLSTEMISEISDWLKESIDHQTGHMRMDKEFSEAYQLHSQMMHDTGNYLQGLADAIELRELSRSGFYNNPLLKSQMLSEPELIRDHNLSERIQSLRQQYRFASSDERIRIGNELLNAISERNSLQNQVVPATGGSDLLSEILSVQEALKADELLIFMSVFNDQVFRYVLTRQEIDMKVFPVSGGPDNGVIRAADTIGYGSTDLEKLYDVYTLYFSDLIETRKEFSHLYFVPDNQFYRIPIEILPVSEPKGPHSYSTTEYLLERISISYLNTPTELNQKSKPGNREFDVEFAGFGIHDFSSAGHPQLQNLPFSPIEVKNSFSNLSRSYKKEIFLNGESTEENFRAAAGHARILHLATHSQVNTDSPLFSTLYFHQQSEGDSGSEGIIQAYELFDMDLNADLVFLSSCESGAGGYLEGAGILGFSRAFEYAGAKSISLNLWPVRDQTAAHIVTDFYDKLNSGLNKAEALREAQLNFMNHTNSDPYLWGSMVIYGDIESPFNDSEHPALIQLISGMILITGSLFLMLAGYRRISHSKE